MPKEYTIEAVSHKVKNWSNQYGDFTTYNIKLPGSDEAIQLNKKSDSEAPNEGDTIFGEITETEFGKRFKSAQKPSGSPTKPTLDYEPSTNARWAIGMAYKAYIQTVGSPESAEGEFPFDVVELHARKLVQMFDKIKSGEPQKKVDKVFDPDKEAVDDTNKWEA